MSLINNSYEVMVKNDYFQRAKSFLKSCGTESEEMGEWVYEIWTFR
jgi:hypothetical protein